jgi:general secretion pathway protein J
MKTGASGGTRAFTLMEIMLALAILGMIVASIFSSWMAIVRGAETGKKAAAAVQRSRIAVRTLQDALMCARSFEANPDYYTFEAKNGSDATLSFVSCLPQSFPRSGRFGEFDVRRVTFSLEPGPDYGRQLVLRQRPVLMEWNIDEKEHPIVLARNVKAFEMEFWDDKKHEWLDEWTETNKLPWMVAIKLRWSSANANSFQSSQGDQGITNVVALVAGTVRSTWQAPVQNRGGRPSVITP